jgi:hypothetical protein
MKVKSISHEDLDKWVNTAESFFTESLKNSQSDLEQAQFILKFSFS